ncbi:transposable element Tcb1 transposase [Trichonephila clavipes]|nr:transposable element Tcb1 transposase [Trichonephila clavipes]
MTSLNILDDVVRLSSRHSIYFQWVHSHIGLNGNEIADSLAKFATADGLRGDTCLTFAELTSIKRMELNALWGVPPGHLWYFERKPRWCHQFNIPSYVSYPSITPVISSIRVRQRKDKGLPRLWIIFKKIGSRVGRNQTTVVRTCDRGMQEGTTNRRVPSHPPQCTTSREDRQIVCMAVTDRSVTSRTIAQHIEFVTHHSVSARTIRRRSQQSGLSARRPLLGLPLTQNHRRLHRQWYDERKMWAAEWNEVVLTDESCICLQHHDGRIRVWRHRGERMLNSCVMHRHTGRASGIMVWGGIEYHSRTPLVRIAGTLNSLRYISEVLEPFVLPYFQGLATVIFQQDNARPHVARIVQRFFINHQIELLPWPARSPDLSPIKNMWSMGAQRLTQIIPPAATPNELWQREEAAWSAVPHTRTLPKSL